MKLPTGKENAVFFKPRIEENYYKAKLLEVKPFQDKEGNWIEDSYGSRKVILDFGVYSRETGKAITYKHEGVERDATLPSFVAVQRKDKEGNYKTCITSKSNAAKAFVALGWEFTEEVELDTESFIGKECKILVGDFEKKDQQGKVIQIFSVIKELGLLKKEGVKSPSSTPAKKTTLTMVKSKEITQQLKLLQSQFDDGFLTQKGYDQAKEQLTNRLEKLK